MSQLVTREDREGGAILRLNRPEKMNALTVDLFAELRAHVEALDKEADTIGAVVLRGEGRCFSAGHDLADISSGENPPKPHFQADTIERLAMLQQPLIVVVHGVCYTGGLELALSGDLIVAGESARFADTHAKWALTPIWGLSQRLPRRVGPSKAREMMFTCRTYTGREAEAMGLADACVEDAALDEYVDRLVADILAQSWFSHRANKRLLLQTDGLPLSAGLAQEVYRTEGRGPDMRDRIAAFAARRPAKA